eukprot:12911333-Alexandrium_andersonii.AAC.1
MAGSAPCARPITATCSVGGAGFAETPGTAGGQSVTRGTEAYGSRSRYSAGQTDLRSRRGKASSMQRCRTRDAASRRTGQQRKE